MICPYPISIPHPHGTANSVRITVPCGSCFACMTNRRQDWTIRILEEWKQYTNALFVTLTYNDDNVPKRNGILSVSKEDLQNFLKRLRKEYPPGKIRYYAVGEYGSKTFRPHYHIILFGVPMHDDAIINSSWNRYNTKGELLYSLGNITVTQLSIRRIVYTTKYHVNKTAYPEGAEPSFALMSKGIGKNYIEEKKKFHDGRVKNSYYQYYEYKKKLPRYYKNKLYSEKERKEISEIFARDDYSIEAFEEFKRKNPQGNFFDDRYDRVKNAQKKFRSKINYNNKI